MPNFEEIAQKHIDSLNYEIPDFKHGFANRKDFFLKVYFSYRLVRLDGTVPPDGSFGGAPGFTIDKRTLETETISRGDLGLLEEKQDELEEMYNGLFDAKNGTNFLLSLKSKYGLSSVQLLTLKKIMEQTNPCKHEIIYQLDSIVLKNQPEQTGKRPFISSTK